MTTMVHNEKHKPNAPTVGAKPPPPLPKTSTTIKAPPPDAMPAPIPSTPPSVSSLAPARGLVIDLDKIDESPSNPRKTFPSEEELRALGESIRDKGLLQDVIVRPHPTKGGRFELVFGACRLRASKLVGLKTIGAKLRELSDAEVLEIQIIENSQRAGVHPLEEAEGFEQLLKKHKYDADTIAAKVNKSREYVYSRIKLLSLSSKARTAFYDGRLTSSTALYIARIPTPELQEKAIVEIDGLSARDASETVRHHFMLKMVDAKFDKKDAMLVPAAGACSTCPKRTANAKELFGDVKGSDLCTDPACFKSKCDADWSKRTAAAKETGQVVLTKTIGNERFDYASTPYVALDVACNQDTKWPRRTYRELLKNVKDAPAIALGRDDEGKLVELVKRDEVKTALEKKHAFAKAESQNEKKRDRQIAAEAAMHAASHKARELATVELVSRVERRQPKAAFFAAVLVALADMNEEDVLDSLVRRELLSKEEADDMTIQEAIEKVKAGEDLLRGLIAEIIAGVGYGAGGRQDLFAAYGVDEKSFEKQARAAVKAEAQKKGKGK